LKEQVESIMRRLNERETLQSLSPRKVWDENLEADIEALDLPNKHSDFRMIALLAGLHLRNDSLYNSHSYAQKIEYDPIGAYWHGIMHRMEGDYSNSKYWFRQVGHHPIMDLLKQKIAEWLRVEVKLDTFPQGRIRDTLLSFQEESGWNSSSFVDLIVWQESSAAKDSTRHILEQLQRIEIMELFELTMSQITTWEK